MKRRLLWQIFPAFVLITALGLFAISSTVSTHFKRFYRQEKAHQLQQLAHAATLLVASATASGDYQTVQSLCASMANKIGVRFTVVLADGKVIADTAENPHTMENHLLRPEISAALAGQTGQAIRISHTVGQEMLYVALPIYDESRIVGAARAAVSLQEIRQTTRSLARQILVYGLIIAAALAAVSLALSWRISRPLELLRQGAERFAKGDLTHRLPSSSCREINTLAESMNQMASQLDERIRTIASQRNQQQAVLSSMVEGVIAIDRDGRVMSMNAAAARMLNVNAASFAGRAFEEIIQNTELQQFVRQMLAHPDKNEQLIVLHELPNPELHIHAQGTPLLGDQNNPIGVLIVLNDISPLKRLEDVRKDFVANVSHELKTPVTSIKGFIETLLDGAMNNPKDCRRFLEIIARQTNRLESIIDDLLTLSQVEQYGQQDAITIQPTPILPLLKNAASLCQKKADEKQIPIEIDCDEELIAPVNDSLLEQAVVNLIDNAVKYSDNQSPVQVMARIENNQLLISVKDYGCGIAKEHLSRIFERFYRIDKARSRKLGGTGLGLSIVKHIANYHKGTVLVESRLGEGSCFTIQIPIHNAA